jgi:hypothetical protein
VVATKALCNAHRMRIRLANTFDIHEAQAAPYHPDIAAKCTASLLRAHDRVL